MSGRHSTENRVCPRSLHRRLLQAVSDEREAVALDPYGKPVPVGPGRRLEGKQYQFDATRSSQLRRGRPIGFRTNAGIFSGIVVDVVGRRLVLELDADLGEVTESGEVLSDVLWLQDALYRRIVEIDAGLNRPATGSRFVVDAALRALGEGDASWHQIPLRDAGNPGGLNEGQQKALRLALSWPTAFIWGPPGTGKSTTLSHLIRVLYQAGRRVLVLAYSNNAVDLLLEKTFNVIDGSDTVADGDILRYGSIEASRLSSCLQARIGFDAVVARRLVELAIGENARDAAMEHVRGQVAQSCRVMGTTVYQAILSPLVRQQYDMVITDEASTVPLAALYAIAGLAPRTVLAGDFRQLGPVVRAQSLAARTWLARDVFEAAGIIDDVERDEPPPFMAMLTEQHRMAPDVCALVSDAYGGRLLTHASVLERPEGPLGPGGLLYLDTGASGAAVTLGARTRSRSNRVHVDVIGRLVDQLVGRRLLRPNELDRIRIMTPFADQARALETRFARYGRTRPHTGTVHVSQARESDIVILDLTDAPNEPASRFWQARNYREPGGRLLTVALSRAKYHLIIVGDFDFHLYRSATGPVLRRTLEHVREHGRDVREIFNVRRVA